MRAYRFVKAYWIKRRMIQALWKALDYDGGALRFMKEPYEQTSYEGPHVALAVLKNERKLKDHYRYTEKSG